MINNGGILYVVAAPSGGGKTSLIEAVRGAMPSMQLSISYTTRPKRPSEVADVHYHYVTKSAFEQLIASEQLLEYANVYGHYYGTSKQWVEEKLAVGQDIILEIDWQGAEQVRLNFPKNHVSIFILPPSREILEQRLRERAQDKPDVIEKRLKEAHEDIAHCVDFDYLIVNDNFETARQDMLKIMAAEQMKTAKQRVRHSTLLESLLT